MGNIVRFKTYIQIDIDEEDVYIINPITEQGYHLEFDFYQIIEPLFEGFINIKNLNYNDYDPESIKEAIDLFIIEGLIEAKEDLDCPIL